MKKLLRDFVQAVWEVIKLPFFLASVSVRRLVRLGIGKLAMLAFAAALVTIITLTIFFETTSQPAFCGSCHLMRPYIASWQESSHAGVSCMKCHAQEGVSGFLETKFTALSMLTNYATGIYKRSKPWAEIEDRNCLECHETRLLEGRIEYGDITFDHTPHLTEERRGRKLRCTSCHSQIVQGSHISVTSSTCFLCHFKNVEQEGRMELAACQTCHTHPPSGDSARAAGLFDHSRIVGQGISCQSCHLQMWQGSGAVRRERCGVCHTQQAHLEKIDDLEFIHEWHVEVRKVDCQMCHDPIEHRRQTVTSLIGEGCQGCHSDQHNPMIQVFSGTGSRLIPEAMPDTMHESGVVCMSCHKDEPGHGIARIEASACTPCHDASYLNLARDWRRGFENRIRSLESALRSAGSHPQIEEARQDLALIKHGGAWHNKRFADAVLTKVAQVITVAGGGRVPTARLPKESAKCLNCHSTIADVPIALPLSEFSHREHLSEREITCTSCHIDVPPEDSRHGRRLPTAKSCADCHHTALAEKGDKCSPCHQPSRAVFTGALPGLNKSPSPMAEADMSCTDCHTTEDAYKPPADDYCLNCHDDEVVSDLNYLRGELLKLTRESGAKGDAAALVKRDGGRAVHNPELAKKVLMGVEN